MSVGAIMNSADAEEYSQALGQITAGAWRQVALGRRLGVPQALGLTTEQWVEHRLGGYTRLAITERREAVAELTAPEENGGMGLSQRQTAAVLGVTHTTVRRDVELVSGTNVPPAVPNQGEPGA